LFLILITACGPAGTKALYKGVYVCGYPNYFMPEAYPGEHWYMENLSSDWQTKFEQMIKSDTNTIIKKTLAGPNASMLYQTSNLAYLGFDMNIEITGIPSKTYKYGYGPHNCCERTVKVEQVHKMVLKKVK
jgi:hypothetical protein